MNGWVDKPINKNMRQSNSLLESMDELGLYLGITELDYRRTANGQSRSSRTLNSVVALSAGGYSISAYIDKFDIYALNYG